MKGSSLKSGSGQSPLLRLIHNASLTQKQLADALGVSSQTVNNWVRGRHQKESVKLSIRQVKILCQILKVDLSQIPDDFGPEGVDDETTD